MTEGRARDRCQLCVLVVSNVLAVASSGRPFEFRGCGLERPDPLAARWLHSLASCWRRRNAAARSRLGSFSPDPANSTINFASPAADSSEPERRPSTHRAASKATRMACVVSGSKTHSLANARETALPPVGPLMTLTPWNFFHTYEWRILKGSPRVVCAVPNTSSSPRGQSR